VRSERALPAAGLALPLASAGVTVGVLLLASRGRIGLTVDSGEYVGAARSLLHGHGLTVAYANADEVFRLPTAADGQRVDVTQFPPLFPALVAAVAWVAHLSVLKATAVVVTASYAVATSRLACLVRSRGLAASVALVAAMLVLPVAEPAMMAWVQPLELLLVVEALVACTRYVRRPRPRTLLRVGAWCAVAALAHTTGLAAAAGAAVAIVMLSPAWRRALPPAAVVLGFGVIPAVGWAAYGRAVGGGVGQKHLGFYPEVELGLVWALLLLAAATALAALALRRGEVVAFTAAGTAAAALLLVLAARYLADRNIALDRRQLHVAGILTTVAAVDLVSASSLRRLLPAAAAALVAAGPVLTLFAGPVAMRSEFAGYRAARWQHSPLLGYVSARSPQAWTLTDAPDAVALLTSGTPIGLPRPRVLYNRATNPHYAEELSQLRCAVAGHAPLLAVFDRPTRVQTPRKPDPVMLAALHAREIARFADGTAYSVDTRGCD
jgi:hypothetical protein